MVGENLLYKGSVNEYRLKIKNIDLYCVGRTVNSSGEVLVAKEGCIYRKLILNEDNPVGAIVLNDPFTASIAEAVFKGKKSVVSSKFYSINYNYQEKEYLNQLIALCGLRYIPKRLARFSGE